MFIHPMPEFFFQVKYALRDPSHDGAGSLSKPLTCAFDAIFSAIVFTASATAQRIAVFSEVFCDADWRVLNSF